MFFLLLSFLFFAVVAGARIIAPGSRKTAKQETCAGNATTAQQKTPPQRQQKKTSPRNDSKKSAPLRRQQKNAPQRQQKNNDSKKATTAKNNTLRVQGVRDLGGWLGLSLIRATTKGRCDKGRGVTLLALSGLRLRVSDFRVEGCLGSLIEPL